MVPVVSHPDLCDLDASTLFSLAGTTQQTAGSLESIGALRNSTLMEGCWGLAEILHKTLRLLQSTVDTWNIVTQAELILCTGLCSRRPQHFLIDNSFITS